MCKLQSSYICGEIANQTKNNEAYNRTKIGNSSKYCSCPLGVSRRGRWSFSVQGLSYAQKRLAARSRWRALEMIS